MSFKAGDTVAVCTGEVYEGPYLVEKVGSRYIKTSERPSVKYRLDGTLPETKDDFGQHLVLWTPEIAYVVRKKVAYKKLCLAITAANNLLGYIRNTADSYDEDSEDAWSAEQIESVTQALLDAIKVSP
jgi:hypothetical protein